METSLLALSYPESLWWVMSDCRSLHLFLSAAEGDCSDGAEQGGAGEPGVEQAAVGGTF